MTELVIHSADRKNPARVLCGQLKMKTGARRKGLRFSYIPDEVTCMKCKRYSP